MVRGAWGALELAWPRILTRLSARPLEAHEVPIARVLGARQLTQALVSARFPTLTVVGLGIGVDALHSLSMLGAGLVLPKYRRRALTSTAGAAAFGLAGWLASRPANTVNT